MKESAAVTEERPWGWFRRFADNEQSTVKILFIKKGEAFSLQKHSEREEFWRVLVGEPDITVGDNVVRAKAGDEFNIERETNHRISSPVSDTEVLEISRGEFNENDIVRIEDKYGRS